MGRCLQCGKVLADGARFCPSCGKPSDAAAAIPAPPRQTAGPDVSKPDTKATGSTLRTFLRSLSRWDAAALLGGVAGAGLWYGWSALDVKDKVTPFYILLIPILIVWLRKPIDRLLLPLQKVKQKIPRMVMIGAGLAAPYFLAHFFYGRGVSEFPLAQKTIIWGTLLSYVILRIPDPRSMAGKSFPRLALFLGAIALTAGFQLLFIDSAFADDFLRDPRRLQDGLRTDGWAQAIAGTAGTVISGLVNGGLVFQKTKPPSSSSDDKGQKEEPARYSMDVRTEDQRMSLAADDIDRLWVYAKITCSKASVDATALTNAITFSFSGRHADWLTVRSTQSKNGYKAILLGACPPIPNAELSEDPAKVKVTVSGATDEGEPIDVPFDLELEQLKLKVTILA